MTDMGGEKARAGGLGCPICKGVEDVKYKPFCSKRCADIDLGRWFNEDYAVPAAEPPDEWDLDLPEEDGDQSSDGFLH